MARRIDWEREALNRKARHGLSIKDETEFRKTDFAARWIEREKQRQQQLAKQREQQLMKKSKPAPPPLKQKPVKSNRPPAANAEALDPKDPFHQLAGVDMTTPPW
jgi:hypothetical protein